MQVVGKEVARRAVLPFRFHPHSARPLKGASARRGRSLELMLTLKVQSHSPRKGIDAPKEVLRDFQ
jgi:hypothetical protein